MHEIDIPERKKRLYMPQHLGECDNDQFAHMAFLFFQYQNKQITYEQMRYNAVYKLLNLEVGQNTKLNSLERGTMNTNIYQLSILVDSFFQHLEDDKIQLRQEFRGNPMKHIPVLKGKLKGPEDNFANMTFGQYLDALDIFGNFIEDPDTQLLYDLCATLYIKGAYNSKNTPKIAKELKKTFFGYVHGAYLVFTTFQQIINNSMIMIEGNLCDLSILFLKPKNYKKYTSYPSIGMKSTAFVLAESGVFGTYNQVRDSNMWDIFARMYDIKVRDLESEKQQEEQQRKQKTKK